MTRYNEQSFSNRLGTLGDEAEGVFEAVWDGPWDRFGWNRPNTNLRGRSARVRYAPDYAVNGGFVECQGFGRDRLLKLKDEKVEALSLWAKDDPLWLFVWDRTLQRWTLIGWQVVTDLVTTPYTSGVYHDGPTWRGLHFDQLSKFEWNDKQA